MEKKLPRKLTFYGFLDRQKRRQDSVGELARDVLSGRVVDERGEVYGQAMQEFLAWRRQKKRQIQVKPRTIH